MIYGILSLGVYGDVVPLTIAEETFTIFMMLFARIFASFLFAEVSSYVFSRHSAFNSHVRLQRRIDRWMTLNNVNNDTKIRVLKYFSFKWEN